MSEDSPAPDANLTARLDALRAAYRGLAEEQKRALLKQVEKVSRAEFDELVAQAGLDRGGHRPKAIIERRDAHARARIDEALTREGNEQPLEFAAWHFFEGVRPDFAEELNKVLDEELDAAGEMPGIDALLSLVQRRAGDKKGWEFFAAAVRANPEAYLESRKAGDGGEAEETPDEGTVWTRSLDVLETTCAELRTFADELAALRPVSFVDLAPVVENAFDISAVLRRNLAAAAAESGFEAELPADAAGLRAYVAALVARRAAQNSPPAEQGGS